MMDVDERIRCSTEFIPCELARVAAAPPRRPSFSPEGAPFHSRGNDHGKNLVSPERALLGPPRGIASDRTTASHSSVDLEHRRTTRCHPVGVNGAARRNPRALPWALEFDPLGVDGAVATAFHSTKLPYDDVNESRHSLSVSPEGARFHSPGRSPGKNRDKNLRSPERAAPGVPRRVAPGWTTASHSPVGLELCRAMGCHPVGVKGAARREPRALPWGVEFDPLGVDGAVAAAVASPKSRHDAGRGGRPSRAGKGLRVANPGRCPGLWNLTPLGSIAPTSCAIRSHTVGLTLRVRESITRSVMPTVPPTAMDTPQRPSGGSSPEWTPPSRKPSRP